MTQGQGILNWRKCKKCDNSYDSKDCPYCLRSKLEEKEDVQGC